MTIHFDKNISAKEFDKFKKYKNLKIEIKHKHNSNSNKSTRNEEEY